MKSQPYVFFGWVVRHVLKLNWCSLDVNDIQDGPLQAPVWAIKSRSSVELGRKIMQNRPIRGIHFRSFSVNTKWTFKHTQEVDASRKVEETPWHHSLFCTKSSQDGDQNRQANHINLKKSINWYWQIINIEKRSWPCCSQWCWDRTSHVCKV